MVNLKKEISLISLIDVAVSKVRAKLVKSYTVPASICQFFWLDKHQNSGVPGLVTWTNSSLKSSFKSTTDWRSLKRQDHNISQKNN